MAGKCPRCEKELLNVDRQGIAVDFCPKCKGVWLDKDELNEIIKRTSGIFSEAIDKEQKEISDELSDDLALLKEDKDFEEDRELEEDEEEEL